MAINVARPRPLHALHSVSHGMPIVRVCLAFLLLPFCPLLLDTGLDKTQICCFNTCAVDFSTTRFFLFSLVLCLCEVCWYKFMEWTTESFAENPKEKLLAEFNLTMSHHSNTRAVQTFSEMHTEPRARERMVKKNPNAFHMVEMRKSSSSSCVHKTIEEKVIVSPRLVRHLTA